MTKTTKPEAPEGASTPFTAADGLLYDTDSAVAFAAEETGYTTDEIARILAARDALQCVVGAAPPSPDVDIEALVRRYPDLLGTAVGQGGMSFDLEAAFIQLETGLPIATVVGVLGADCEYMQRRGIVDSFLVASYKAWAREQIETTA